MLFAGTREAALDPVLCLYSSEVMIFKARKAYLLWHLKKKNKKDLKNSKKLEQYKIPVWEQVCFYDSCSLDTIC